MLTKCSGVKEAFPQSSRHDEATLQSRRSNSMSPDDAAGGCSGEDVTEESTCHTVKVLQTSRTVPP